MQGKFFFEKIVFLIHNLGYVGLNLCLCYSLLLQQLFLHTLALFFKYHLFKFAFIALEMSLFTNLYKEQLHQLYHVYFTLLNDCYIRINVWYIKAFLELRDFIKCTFLSYLNLLRQYSRVNALQLAIKLNGFSLLSFLLFLSLTTFQSVISQIEYNRFLKHVLPYICIYLYWRIQ